VNLRKTVRWQTAAMGIAMIVALGLQASSGQAAAANCTTSHCATIQVTFITSIGIPGIGAVVGSDGVLDCLDTTGHATGTCVDRVSWPLASPTTNITITALPNVGAAACYSPDGVNGACSPLGQTYVLPRTLLPNTTVSLTFYFNLSQQTLIVLSMGSGAGVVRVNSAVVSSTGGGMGTNYNYGSVIQLTPSATTGTFAGWGRDCAGQGSTCTLTMTGTHRVTAEFDLPGATPTPPPSTGAHPTSTPTPTPTPTPTQPGARISPAGLPTTPSAGPPGVSPGSTVEGATAGASSSADSTVSPSPSSSADPQTPPPPGSEGPPWLPIIAVVVLLVVGLIVVIFQLVRARRPGP